MTKELSAPRGAGPGGHDEHVTDHFVLKLHEDQEVARLVLRQRGIGPRCLTANGPDPFPAGRGSTATRQPSPATRSNLWATTPTRTT